MVVQYPIVPLKKPIRKEEPIGLEHTVAIHSWWFGPLSGLEFYGSQSAK